MARRLSLQFAASWAWQGGIASSYLTSRPSPSLCLNLTKKDAEWKWTNECQRAFENIRDALVSQPVLAIADPNKSYTLLTDASNYAMGAILMQDDENGEPHPIAYASKTFNDAQRNYDTTEKEALAFVWALQHSNTYCEGHKYVLLTNHIALSYIRVNKDQTKRIYRWQVLLQGYDLQIKYLPGKDNHAADLLSRDAMITSSSTAPVRVNAARVKKWQRSQRVDAHAVVSLKKSTKWRKSLTDARSLAVSDKRTTSTW